MMIANRLGSSVRRFVTRLLVRVMMDAGALSGLNIIGTAELNARGKCLKFGGSVLLQAVAMTSWCGLRLSWVGSDWIVYLFDGGIQVTMTLSMPLCRTRLGLTMTRAANLSCRDTGTELTSMLPYRRLTCLMVPLGSGAMIFMRLTASDDMD